MRNRTIYADDCLNVLNDELEIEPNLIDLIYLDPPFNSKSTYTLPFKAKDKSARPVDVFVDTWDWDEKEDAIMDRFKRGPATKRIYDLITLVRQTEAPRVKYSTSAYLVNMAARLIPMKRVLKDTGSIYLHCDTTAGHYLKLLMDLIFGRGNFRNEIIWRRTGSHNSTRSYGAIHDTILFYSVSGNYTFNVQKRPYAIRHVEERYSIDDTGRAKQVTGGNILTGQGVSGGESGKPWRGFDPSSKNRHWAVPAYLNDQLSEEEREEGVLARMDTLYSMGLIEIKDRAAWPHPVRYLEKDDGQPYQDIWAYQPYTDGILHGTDEAIDQDVMWVGPTSPERYGYPTQKPMALLERIIKTSSNKGDIILDPFCGCGTAVHAAEANGRQWAGIDISHFSAGLMRNRILANFNNLSGDDIHMTGVPDSQESARELARQDKFAFEKWVCGHVGAEGMFHDPGTKGADGGVDGVLKFVPTIMGKKPKEEYAIVQVKGGNVTPDAVRALTETIERFEAKAGIIICFNDQMRTVENNRSKRLFRDSMGEYPVIQGLSVEAMLDGANPKLPPILKKAA